MNTFKFTNAKGKVTFGRYQIRPETGDQSLSKDQDAKADPNYLTQEIRERVAQAPVWFKLFLEIAEEGDDLDNPSVAWPESRKKMELGSIEITRAVADNVAAERQLFFQPGALPSGIERPGSDDQGPYGRLSGLVRAPQGRVKRFCRT